jgi:hypothetical protein
LPKLGRWTGLEGGPGWQIEEGGAVRRGIAEAGPAAGGSRPALEGEDVGERKWVRKTIDL